MPVLLPEGAYDKKEHIRKREETAVTIEKWNSGFLTLYMTEQS